MNHQDQPSSPELLSFPPGTSFADGLQQAVRRSGLSLDRVRHRLAVHGVRVSLTTLSYWQRGRSEPERARSLRAVEVLETVLAVRPGALRSLIGPYRPRGRTAPPAHDVSASHRVFGEDSLVERVLGPRFAALNESVSTLSIRETVTLDERRRLVSLAIQQVMRASRAGADHFTTVHTFDGAGARGVRVAVRCGLLAELEFRPEMDSVAIEIGFGRRLARNETVVIDYTVQVEAGDGTDDHYERRTRVPLRDYLLQVYFDPRALPVVGHRYYLERHGAPAAYRHRIALDASHTVHSAPGRAPAGIHGISWEWPEPGFPPPDVRPGAGAAGPGSGPGFPQ